MALRHQLTPQLKQLRLSGILETLEARNRQAIDDQWSYIEFLSRLLEDECVDLRTHRRGKSHLAQGLVHEACRAGFDALFVNVHKMLSHLNGGRADGTFERRLQSYLRPDLLVLDDFGLKPLQPPAPEDLYDIINERYEQSSIMLTSNRAPGEWPDLFGDPLLASAGLDRLAHHAETWSLQAPASEPRAASG